MVPLTLRSFEHKGFSKWQKQNLGRSTQETATGEPKPICPNIQEGESIHLTSRRARWDWMPLLSYSSTILSKKRWPCSLVQITCCSLNNSVSRTPTFLSHRARSLNFLHLSWLSTSSFVLQLCLWDICVQGCIRSKVKKNTSRKWKRTLISLPFKEKMYHSVGENITCKN